jgi:hypothetical protein
VHTRALAAVCLLLLQVGKTSLINALKDGLSPPIAPEHRTVSVQVSRRLLEDGVDLRIWDFAGAALAVALMLRRGRFDTRMRLQGRRCTTCRTPFISLSVASTS